MIVVGVDGSSESVEVLRWAVEEARLRGTTVRAVFAWSYPQLVEASDPYLIAQGYSPIPVDPEQPSRLARAQLAAAIAPVAGGEVVQQDVIEGHAAEVLVAAARSAELLVVGSRGHGGFAGLLLGSVSQACAHHAACPVVIVRGRQPSD